MIPPEFMIVLWGLLVVLLVKMCCLIYVAFFDDGGYSGSPHDIVGGFTEGFLLGVDKRKSE